MSTRYTRPTTLSGTTPTWNVNKYFWAEITAGGNVAVTLAIDNYVGGIFYFTQDATGSRTLTISGQSVSVDPTPTALTVIHISYAFSTLGILSSYAEGGDSATTDPASAYTVEDSFTGSAGNLTGHTPEAGGAISKAWSETGDMVLVGDGTMKVSGASGVGACYAYAATFSGADQTAFIVLKKNTSSLDVDLMSVMLRCDLTTMTNKTCYEYRFMQIGSGIVVYIYVYNNTTPVELGNATISEFNDNAYHTCELRAIGTSIQLIVDGSTKISVTDSVLVGGVAQRNMALLGYTAAVSGVGDWIVNGLTGDA